MLGFVGALVAAGFLAMVGTFGYQAYLYLKYGEWIGLSVTYACGQYLEWEWCNFPQDWLGVHNLLSWFNVGAFAFLASVLAMWAAMALEGGGK